MKWFFVFGATVETVLVITALWWLWHLDFDTVKPGVSRLVLSLCSLASVRWSWVYALDKRMRDLK